MCPSIHLKFSRIRRKIRRYLVVTKVMEIARRYFVMNAFDGVLTMLGVMVGAYMAGNINPKLIISAGISASIAMGISGFSGAYLTEKAERRHKLKKLEQAMLLNLEHTLQSEASNFAYLFTAFVDGISPMLAALIVTTPFLLANIGWIEPLTAFYWGVILTLSILFILGLYLGKISQEGRFKYAFTMLAVGIITALLALLATFFAGKILTNL